MIFTYQAITSTGEKKSGTIDAGSRDLAIAAIQRRGLIVSSVIEEGKKKGILNITIFEKTVKMKDVVIMSRQLSTLFEAQVSALKAFDLLATNTENSALVKVLHNVSEDISSGITISNAMSKHPEVFSDFYINMIKAGEESGKLTQTFSYLADYLDRQYQLTSKTKNALIYPGFVIGVFFVVMTLMFVFIVPRLAVIIKESGQAIPLSTQIVMGISDLLLNYGIYILIAFALFVIYVYRLTRTKAGQKYLDSLKISTPVMKNIYIKLYLSRIADNMDTMLSSGIPIIRAIELTSAVVGNRIFSDILKEATEAVKGGSSLSDSLSKHPEIPPVMSGMIRVGEETGSIGNILKTLGKFYTREVNDAVDTLVSLIEPIMIVALGLGVGVLLASVLMPIYNIAGGIQ
ncbi:MAG TPA: type II secretion system F family protein [Candidatus Paceibacterota bacterium]|nr:type II secretion system F family protein [Candidatus Paceibacterota bacterium]